MEPLELVFRVGCIPTHAFEVWTEGMGTWWPASHTVAGVPGTRMTFEGRVGGRVFERSPDGTEVDAGEVVAWDPPHRVAYTWHLMFDCADATDVEITFTASDDGTEVRITHSGWERLGAPGEERRRRNEAGWTGVFEHYRKAAERG